MSAAGKNCDLKEKAFQKSAQMLPYICFYWTQHICQSKQWHWVLQSDQDNLSTDTL